jgi:hypothetical protein
MARRRAAGAPAGRQPGRQLVVLPQGATNAWLSWLQQGDLSQLDVVVDPVHLCRQALLEAERSGTTWRDQGLKPAPHFLDADGTVKVPQNWQSMVRCCVTRVHGRLHRYASSNGKKLFHS